MKSIWLDKRCPRCNGSLYLEEDPVTGKFIKCFMCSRMWGLNMEKIQGIKPGELKKYFKGYQKHFGLNGYRVYFKHEKLEGLIDG